MHDSHEPLLLERPASLSPKLRVVLADDHAVIREGLKRLLLREPDIEVVGEAGDGDEACHLAATLRPDVMILDLSMPRTSGMVATQHIKKHFAGIKILVLTVHEDTTYFRALLQTGVSGYVLKTAAADELVAGIRTIQRGGVYVHSKLQHRVMSVLLPPSRRASQKTELSDREVEVMRSLARGYSNKEIAAQLCVSIKTVETYKARSMEKLGLRSRVDLVQFATREGWL
jgi:DNA-binding NarL/FixJ family response regulator